MSTISRVVSDGRMTHLTWKRQGRPVWWIRAGTGASIEYLRIPDIRGDERLNVTVNVDPGTKVWIGVGWDRGSVRETTITLPATYDVYPVAEKLKDLLRNLNKDQITDALAIVIRDTIGRSLPLAALLAETGNETTNPDPNPDPDPDPNPKTKAILDQVRVLARAYPDFVYSSDGRYLYNGGGDPKYPELYGCIMGQAARLAGIDTAYWDSFGGWGPNIGIKNIIADRIGESYRSPAADILARIQELQDEGIPWGEAYAGAVQDQ